MKSSLLSRIEHLQAGGITIATVPPASESVNEGDKTVTQNYEVSGGNGDVSMLSGTVNMSGAILITEKKGRRVAVNDLKLNLEAGTFEGTPDGSDKTLVFLNAHGVTTATSSTTQTYNASKMTISAAGAAFLNEALDTEMFAEGDVDSSLTATWAFSSFS